ncbi:Coronin-like protein crn1 [Smittium culicis]|uniref:Coronin n=1 Tax=Smittium culicis TaxID=133412 RepID=A0A1R1XUZ6_9FUNG|nr:Coronin-like protein crn1 [Smittium culicis]
MYSFVRASKYRHVFGQAYKRDECYENLKITNSAWDSNIISVNPKYFAVNWNAGGGGAFCVVPLSQSGRLDVRHPLFTGHSGQVLDTDFSPFNNDIIASGAEDGNVMVWKINEADLAVDRDDSDENIEPLCFNQPLLTLRGHEKKVGFVKFHKSAENVLASAGADQTVRLWDVEYGTEKSSVSDFNDTILSFDFNYDGSLIACPSRDKTLRIIDPREGKIVNSGNSHLGIKGSRVVWLGNTGKLITTGFNRMSHREVCVWDPANLSSPTITLDIDTSSGVLMPFYDEGSNMLYLAGKGDGNIRYYEYESGKLHYVSEYQSTEPQRGMGALTKTAVNLRKYELMRLYKVTSNNIVEPISFQAPRKGNSFLADIYPPNRGSIPAQTSAEYFSGQTKPPVLVDLESIFNGLPEAVASPVIAQTKIASTPTPAPASPVAKKQQPSVTPTATDAASINSAPAKPKTSGLTNGSANLSEGASKLLAIAKLNNQDDTDEEDIDDAFTDQKRSIPSTNLNTSAAADTAADSVPTPVVAPPAAEVAAPSSVPPVSNASNEQIANLAKELESMRILNSENQKELSKISLLESKIADQIQASSETSTTEISKLVAEISAIKLSQESLTKDMQASIDKLQGHVDETANSQMNETIPALVSQIVAEQVQLLKDQNDVKSSETVTELQKLLSETKSIIASQEQRITHLEAQLLETVNAASELASAVEKL